MRSLAIAAITVGVSIILLMSWTYATLWFATRKPSAFHDTYYVLPPLYQPVISALIALSLITWGVWQLRKARRD